MLCQTPTEYYKFLYVENITCWGGYRQKCGLLKTYLRMPAASKAGWHCILTVEFLGCSGADQAGEFARVVFETRKDWSKVLHA